MKDRIISEKYPLPEKYVPEELVPVRIKFKKPVAFEKTFMVREAAQSLERLVKEAGLDGVEVTGISAYRSYTTQKNIFLRSILKRGIKHTRKYIAFPGTSEHQSGLAIDVGCSENNYELEESFVETNTYKWLVVNAYLYGFVIRYPKGCEKVTGYAFEPWHLRYVGVELAEKMNRSKKCLEEILLKC